MAENISCMGNNEKSRIRERYKGVSPEELDVIPAIHEVGFYEDESKKQVAVYARVSTDDPRQTSSFELQRNHYEDIIRRHKGWELFNIYADEGISGTSLRHRNAFIKMIEDCEAGRIDLIVTKSVSRFARNVYDCIGYVRKLAALRHPVGVFFETENLYTLNRDSEMSLSFIATLAQEESHTKSNSMNLSYEMRFRRGIFLTPALLGYDVNEDGFLVINEEEALTVRLIFFMYLYGYSCQQIADTLAQLGRLTKKGNQTWSSGTVLGILQNERHCGDVLAHKTWTPNYLDHKSRKNVGNRNMYRKKDHHDAIISRDDYIATQRLIANAKYGYKGVLPTLHVIDEGALCGFVIVNMRWAGFNKDDYMDASFSAMPNQDESADETCEMEPSTGEFDLREYELVRTQFFGSFQEESATFSMDRMHFSAACIRKIEHTAYVEILLNPQDKIMAVRPTTKDNRNAVHWAAIKGDKYLPRSIKGTVFLNVMYDIMGWDQQCKYRIHGVQQKNETGAIMMFDLREPEIIIPTTSSNSTIEENTTFQISDGMTPLIPHSKKSVVAFPASWVESFGYNYYEGKNVREIIPINADNAGDTQQTGRPFKRDGEELQTTSSEDLSHQISVLMDAMKQEEQSGG
jgi:site-specific DNA recombinase